MIIIDSCWGFSIPIGLDHRCVHCLLQSVSLPSKTKQQKRNSKLRQPTLNGHGPPGAFQTNILSLSRASSPSRFFFFPLLFLQPSLVDWSVSRHARNTKGKSPGPIRCLWEWRESSGRGWVGRGFGQDLAPVALIGFNVVRIWGGFAEKGGCKGGHGCMCQGGGPACSESGCNALLEDGGCLSRFGSWQSADKGCGLFAPPAPNLDCKHHQSAALVVEEFWVSFFFAFAGILQSGSYEPSCSASGLAFSSEW